MCSVVFVQLERDERLSLRQKRREEKKCALKLNKAAGEGKRKERLLNFSLVYFSFDHLLG